MPALCYGVEVFTWGHDRVNMLRLSAALDGVAEPPGCAVDFSTGLDSCTLEWKVRGLGFFLGL